MAAGLTDHRVDDARVVEPADPPAALGRPQTARATAEAIQAPEPVLA